MGADSELRRAATYNIAAAAQNPLCLRFQASSVIFQQSWGNSMPAARAAFGGPIDVAEPGRGFSL